MRFQNVCLEAIGAEIPEEIWSSDQIEAQLAPLYQRIKLPEGRLALMSGIDVGYGHLERRPAAQVSAAATKQSKQQVLTDPKSAA